MTAQFQTLFYFGLGWSSLTVLASILLAFDKTFKVGVGLGLLDLVLTLAWLLTATIFRFSNEGRVCSGAFTDLAPYYYPYGEGLFLARSVLAQWCLLIILSTAAVAADVRRRRVGKSTAEEVVYSQI